MKSFLQSPISSLLFVIAFGNLASAQEWAPTEVRIHPRDVDLEISMQKTPQYNVQLSDTKKDGKTKEWLEIEVKFKTESNSKIKLIPKLSIQYYIMVNGKVDALNATLTDLFNYQFIEDGEDQFAAVYVSPSSLAPIAAGMREFKEGDVTQWGVEFLFSGRVIATRSSTPNNSPWWNDPRAYQKANGLLKAKEDTPFNLTAIDRYIEAVPE